jgi:RNA polymerase sigma-70 factor (ECF subfamily)
VSTIPETSESLLAKLRDPADHEAWSEFVSIYRPLIYRVARTVGMQDADALNLTQDVLSKVAQQSANWDATGRPQRFRGWLATVARNAAIDSLRLRRPDQPTGSDSVAEVLQSLPAGSNRSQDVFRLELERQAFRWAARRIHSEFTETTWIAFWETTVVGRPCSEVAEQLGRRVGAIYTARSRVMERLRIELADFDWQANETDNPTENKS